jgi:ribose transport system ATP-binding protein
MINSDEQPISDARATGQPQFSGNLLQIRGLSKRYSSLTALDGINFDLRAGEVMALLGENGAGKSTLVKILSGLIQPDEGTIEIRGATIDLYPASASQIAGIAVVHQEFSSIGSMTVAENLSLGSVTSPAIWRPRDLTRAARPVLESVGLGGLDPRVRVEKLTVAEEQLLEIAKALSRDSEIIILDEPTATLFDVEIQRILTVVRSLADDGRSVIYVTHRLPEVFQVADRVTVLRNGHSIPPVNVADLTPDSVVRMMLGRRLGSMFPARASVQSEIVLNVAELRAAGLRDGVSLTVHAGRILGLTGQLGSGADVVVRALAGVAPATAREVTLCGRPVPLGRYARLIRSGVAYCSANRRVDGVFAAKPLYQNITSPWLKSVARWGWIQRRREQRDARRVATRFTIDVARMGTRVGNLSGGNQQKVALGKWLGVNPRLLLVEEPTRGVDVGARAEIYAQLRSLCDDGLSVVVSSSDVLEVLGLCDTIGTFYKGRLTALRSHNEWTAETLAQEVMHSGLSQ